MVDPLVDELVERLRAEQGGQHRAELCRLRRHKIFAVKLHMTVRLRGSHLPNKGPHTSLNYARVVQQMPKLLSPLSLSLSLSLRFYLSI